MNILLHVELQVWANDILGIIRRLHEVSNITEKFITRTYRRCKEVHPRLDSFVLLLMKILRTIPYQIFFDYMFVNFQVYPIKLICPF